MKHHKKLLAIRVILGILIVLNMGLIFVFSAQSGEDSGKTSGKVTRIVAELTVPSFSEKSPIEQAEIIQRLHHPVRKLAHMTEFGTLGGLIFLFLLTWKGKTLPKYGISLIATFLYACTDEAHQMLSDSRGPQFRDVLVDLSGAVICCTVILLITCILTFRKKGNRFKFMQTTRYYLNSPKKDLRVRLAVVADLHGEPYEKLISTLRREQPDMILIPGDLMEDDQLEDENASGYAFLRLCVALCPTFYSLGNHEIGCYNSHNPLVRTVATPLTDTIKKRIADTGAILLDNAWTRYGDFCICGLTSGLNGKKSEPDQQVLEQFAAQDGFQILLCHHPEYYVPYVQKTDIDLTICGHAHGGQWRIFGRGVYAPGQGIFPKYTAGVIDNRCVISRGLGNHTHIPRIFNRREFVMIYYGYSQAEIEGKNKK